MGCTLSIHTLRRTRRTLLRWSQSLLRRRLVLHTSALHKTGRHTCELVRRRSSEPARAAHAALVPRKLLPGPHIVLLAALVPRRLPEPERAAHAALVPHIAALVPRRLPEPEHAAHAALVPHTVERAAHAALVPHIVALVPHRFAQGQHTSLLAQRRSLAGGRRAAHRRAAHRQAARIGAGGRRWTCWRLRESGRAGNDCRSKIT